MSERLKKLYKEKIVPKLIEKFNLKNSYQAPKIQKIVINQGLGSGDSKLLKISQNELSLISGQLGVYTRAKKSIAPFKIKQKSDIGILITLRGKKMYAFLDRLISLAIPRIRDFSGLNPKSFDDWGNFSFGLEEQLIFPEIDYNKIDKIRGMNVSIITTTNNKFMAYYLLTSFGMVFKNTPEFEIK